MLSQPYASTILGISVLARDPVAGGIGLIKLSEVKRTECKVASAKARDRTQGQ